MHQLANTITSIRILCSITLLFCVLLSPTFYALYILAGLTDIMDGWIARKTNTASEFGAKLDTFADFTFLTICAIKLLPIMEISVCFYTWIGVIAVIKLFNVIGGYLIHKRFIALHTFMNKLTGALLFIFPLTINILGIKIYTTIVCVLATFTAIQEGYYIIKSSQTISFEHKH